MLLVVDVGNTNVVFGLYQEDHLRHVIRAETRRERTADEYAVLARQLLSLHGFEPGGVTGAILASVVPPLTEVLLHAVKLAFGCQPMVVGPGVKTGISVLVQNSREVGADRIVNAAAAHALAAAGDSQRGAIVVDFGTATTFDCVSPRGEYLGGAIVPGVTLSLDALAARAAKLHPVEITAPPRVVGTSTTHCVQSGIVHGYASLVDGLVEKLGAELGFETLVVATGGLSPLISQHAARIARVEPDLTLLGLRLIHERNYLTKS